MQATKILIVEWTFFFCKSHCREIHKPKKLKLEKVPSYSRFNNIPFTRFLSFTESGSFPLAFHFLWQTALRRCEKENKIQFRYDLC